ncbi:hypothetical protein LY15_004576 [Prauserella flava]|uniref:Uncharacterized protein n=1 Tax=Prauserella sediminis TaxID=577680 RepID=A0A839XSP8_9PSEU|nr:hypothetical protein [Prauserella sediminis]MCR3722575.1 hypothetical protein [Prauserella flava]MCR3737017.1 hypothetical protein [Prauserella salsuginis]
MSENRGACGASLIGADRVEPTLRHALSPQRGRVPHKTQEAA